MSKALKMELIVSDISEEGEIASFLVTKEQFTSSLSKKADLANGKLNESQLPDFVATSFAAVNNQIVAVERTSGESLQIAKDYAEAYTDDVISTKADLVLGKVPSSQLPKPADDQGVRDALSKVLSDARAEMIQRTDELQLSKAELGEDGKVLKEQLPRYDSIPGLETVVRDLYDNKVDAAEVFLKSETLDVAGIEATVERIAPTRTEVDTALMMSEVVQVHGFEQKYIDAGGYPFGAVLTLDDGVTQVKSTVANNKNNPNSNVVGWTPHGVGKFITGMSYGLNAGVILTNGDIVKSTIANNTANPNVDMTGWVSAWKDDYRRKLNGTLSIYEVMTFAEYSAYNPASYEVFDATAILQRAIDTAYAEAKEIFVPSMFAIKANALVLPAYVSFVGQEFGMQTTRYKSGFAAYTNDMFVANSANPTYGGMKRVNFFARNMVFYSKVGQGSNLFKDFCIYGGDIHKCFTYNWGVVIRGGLAYCTKIYNNIFLHTHSYFISSSIIGGGASTIAITDSDVYRNYINGTTKGNCIGFDLGGSSHFNISNNFIDFMYKGVYSGLSYNGDIKDNIFDVCYRGVDVLNANAVNISGNKPLKTQKSYASLFTDRANGDHATELNTEDWIGIKVVSIQDSVITNNVGSADTLLNINGFSIANLETSGNKNTYQSGQNVVISIAKGAGLLRDGQDIKINELAYREVQTLPTPEATVGGSARQTFKGDIVKFNEQVLVNNGTAWRALEGLGILYKHSRTFLVTPVPSNAALKFGPFTIAGLKVGAKIEVTKQTNIADTIITGECIADNQYYIIVYNYGAVSTTQSNHTFNVIAQNL